MPLSFAIFHGPNPYSMQPVLVARWVARADEGTDGSREQMLALRERLAQQHPGWLQPVDGQAWLPASHLAGWTVAQLARGALNAVRGEIETVGASEPKQGWVDAWVGFHVAALARQALAWAFVECFGRTGLRPTEAVPTLPELLQLTRREHPDYIARILMLGARSMDLPVAPSPALARAWRFGWGRRSRVMFEASPARESWLGTTLAGDKWATRQLLGALGLPHTEQRRARSEAEALHAAAALGWPVVVKPADAGKGKGVTAGITDADALRAAFRSAQVMTRAPLLVERFVPGTDHRLLVVRGQLVAATRRDPPQVVGDGQRTLAELVAALNAARAAVPEQRRYLKQIVFDDVVTQHLQRQGLHTLSVPQPGQIVTLRSNANVSTGGHATAVLSQVHPAVRRMAEAVAAAVGLDCIGIDYITPDIAADPAQLPGAVIEVNAKPGLDLHIADMSHDEATLGRIVLGDGLGRIPVVMIVAPPALHDALAAALQAAAGSAPAGFGWATPQQAQVDGLPLRLAEQPMVLRSDRLLSHPACSAAVIVVDAAEVERHGLPLDRVQLLLCVAFDDQALQGWYRSIAARASDRFDVIEGAAAEPRALVQRALTEFETAPAMAAAETARQATS